MSHDIEVNNKARQQVSTAVKYTRTHSCTNFAAHRTTGIALYRRLEYRKLIAHRTRFNALFKAFITIQTPRMDYFKWNNKAGEQWMWWNAVQITKARRLIVDPRGSLLLPAIVSFLSFLTNWCPTLAPCTHVYESCAATKRFIQVECSHTYLFSANKTFKYNSSTALK